jgi:hypothetical protein
MENWFNDRLGLFTSSQISRLMVTERSGKGFGVDAKTYIMEVLAEMLTGERKEEVTSKSIEWGNYYETMAMEEYTKKRECIIEYFGKENPKFFKIDSHPAGGSPDGIAHYGNETILLEIKCPYNSVNHIDNAINDIEWFKKNRKEYYAQVQLNMVATNCMEADFISYDPRMIEGSISILRIPYDVDFCSSMFERITEAAVERDRIYELFNEKTKTL